MIKTTTVSAMALSLALATGVTGIVSTLGAAPAFAQAAAPAKKVSNKLGKQFQEASAFVKQRKFKEALTILEELKAAPGKTAYENFLIDELSSASYLGLQDYANAVKAMEGSLESGQAPEASKQQRRKNIAMLYFTAKNYAKFGEESAKYQKEYGADLDLQNLAVQQLYQAGNFKGAADAGRQLIKTATEKGQPVKEDWLKLIRFAEHEQGNTVGEQAALEQLIQKFPSQQYWSDLLVMTSKNIKGSNTRLQLELYLLMLDTNTMAKPEDYTGMAELALQANLPAEAKKVIDIGMQKKVLGEGPQKDRTLRLLNLAKTQADEATKNLPTAETEAKAAATGDADVHVGETYWVMGQPDKAIEAIQRGIKKGVKDKDGAQVRLGVIYLGQGKRPQALDAFKAVAPNSPWAPLVRAWTLYGTAKQV